MNILLEKVSLYYIIIFCAIPSNVWTRHSRYDYAERDTNLSLWINEQQVKMFSGNIELLLASYKCQNIRLSYPTGHIVLLQEKERCS